MNLPFFQVDAFAAQAGRGNSAGVYLLPDDDFTDDHLQILATDLGLSETGFLLERPAGWSLRWFTPKVEIPLCGHGTVAAAHVLWEQGLLGANEPARFYTRSGLLQARRTPDGWIELDFPRSPTSPTPSRTASSPPLRVRRWPSILRTTATSRCSRPNRRFATIDPTSPRSAITALSSRRPQMPPPQIPTPQMPAIPI